MGVYNPFAELPNSCALCESREKCDLYRQNVGRSVYRHNDCPLVEVKPHGRLIDADAILNESGNYIELYGHDKLYHETILKNAPTVIEAEGEK